MTNNQEYFFTCTAYLSYSLNLLQFASIPHFFQNKVKMSSDWRSKDDLFTQSLQNVATLTVLEIRTLIFQSCHVGLRVTKSGYANCHKRERESACWMAGHRE